MSGDWRDCVMLLSRLSPSPDKNQIPFTKTTMVSTREISNSVCWLICFMYSGTSLIQNTNGPEESVLLVTCPCFRG